VPASERPTCVLQIIIRRGRNFTGVQNNQIILAVVRSAHSVGDGAESFFRDRDICRDTGARTRDEPRHLGPNSITSIRCGFVVDFTRGSINQSIKLLKAKGPNGHLRRSKIHDRF